MAETPKKAVKTTAKKTAAKTAVKKSATKTVATKTVVKKTAAMASPTHAEIAALAHKYYVERGGHHGSDAQDWLRAEKALKG
jgi:hypothetical protein